MLLSSIIGSNQRLRILLLLARKPAYQREIELTLDLPLYAVQIQLKRLEEDGVLDVREVGNRKYFGFNEEYPLYRQLIRLFRRASRLMIVEGARPQSKFKSYHKTKTAMRTKPFKPVRFK